MRSVCTLPVRQAAIAMFALGVLLTWAAPVSAQGFGLGARLAWVKPDVDDDVDVDVDAVRFVGCWIGRRWSDAPAHRRQSGPSLRHWSLRCGRQKSPPQVRHFPPSTGRNGLRQAAHVNDRLTT